jgi:RHS repeat-associated protein
VDVYFDDMEVQLIDAPTTNASDYYPFGLAMADRSYTSEKYRFGYQGQFAEMDEETGWNSFELRMYDPVIGRWMVPDPIRQYWSPYLSMGNNPIRMMDADGGFSCPDGDCGEMDILQANNLVMKYFDPENNQKDISYDLIRDITELYEPGSIEFYAFTSLVADAWSSILYLDVVNPSLSELFISEINNAQTIGDALNIIYARTLEVENRRDKFDIMSLILNAYATAFVAGTSGSGAQPVPQAWSYRGSITHAFGRMVDRGVTKAMADDAIKNYLKKYDVTYDLYGRAAQKYVGRQATVIMNPETGRRITVYRTHARIVRQLLRNGQ